MLKLTIKKYRKKILFRNIYQVFMIADTILYNAREKINVGLLIINIFKIESNVCILEIESFYILILKFVFFNINKNYCILMYLNVF